MNLKSVKPLVLIAIFFLASCENENVSVPQISNFELGLENSKTAYPGDEVHVEADIIAEGKISTVEVEIHPEGLEGAWEFDSLYTEFSGLKNTTFHKHIDISAVADTGEYHFHFIVTDLEGNQTEHEDDLQILAPTDGVAPEVTVSSAPGDGQSFSNGDVISISGSVSDDVKLGGIYIGLVRNDQGLSDSEVDATNTITMLHNHDFDNPLSYDFSASITVGAEEDNNITPKSITGDIAWQTADYYIVVKCKDAYGANWAYSAQYPIKINY